MPEGNRKQNLKSIEKCPRCSRGYSTEKYRDICPFCHTRLDLPEWEDLTPEERRELTFVDKKDYPYGMLVGTNNLTKGYYYKICAGKNTIGSHFCSDIHILGDSLIECSEHAIITYDKDDRTTTIEPGESCATVYVQGKIIYGIRELAPRDRIEIGESEFMFIPICGEKFDWPD